MNNGSIFGPLGPPDLTTLFVVGLVWLAMIWPSARICRRIGFSRWLGILAIVPVANILLLWFVALARWRNVQADPGSIERDSLI